jgi:ubiquinone/menaquinone biosynthesis C-methylase UbiE
MNLRFQDKLKMYIQIVGLFKLLPISIRIAFLLNPIEATRYTEFTYILKYFWKKGDCHSNFKVLDVSSPYILSYCFFNRKCTVIKSDINPSESRNIKSYKNLKFKIEDAINLKFPDNSFDIVYSISVIEHIYKNYTKAILEMIRVCKPGGLLYLTFPVSKDHLEEWLNHDIYHGQAKINDEVFFQYRFNKNDVKGLNRQLETYAEFVSSDIYWERKCGDYDKLVSYFRKNITNAYFKTALKILLNYWYGFFVFQGRSETFSEAKNFGNAHYILRKK